MDIKKLEQVNTDGLEQWKPVMKGGFPLPAAELKKVFESLGVSQTNVVGCAIHAGRDHRAIHKTDPRLHVVNVHKKRTRYTVEGCMGEMTEVIADGKKIARSLLSWRILRA